MAEIRVEPRRRSSAWVWVLLVIVVLAVAGYLVLSQNLISFN